MNRQAKPSHRNTPLAALLALALGLSACSRTVDEAPPVEPPLAGADIGGSFELMDSSGNTVRWSDFEGQYRLVYFGYAYCPDVCPNDVGTIARGLNQLGDEAPDMRAKIKPIFITIDPDRDTPEIVGQFTSAFSDDFIGLTGSNEQVQVAVDAFKVYAQKGEDLGADQYLMDHSNITYLMGKSGEPLALIPTDEGPDGVAAEIRKWVS